MDRHLTYHKRYTLEELDAEYNFLTSRPGYTETVLPDWAQQSAKVRSEWGSKNARHLHLDLAYGLGTRQKLDLFTCDSNEAPTLIYFHGGYWHRGDKSMYSFIAPPFVAAGANVAIIGYDLCPDVSLPELIVRAREGVIWLLESASELGLGRTQFSIMGHSAGGHLTHMMLASDWSCIGDGACPFKSAISLSPVTYLEPVRLVPSVNSVVGMTALDAFCESPMTLHPPRANIPQLVCVGANETLEFQRQAQMYVDAYNAPSRPIEFCPIANADHFEIVNQIVQPKSQLRSKICNYIFS